MFPLVSYTKEMCGLLYSKVKANIYILKIFTIGFQAKIQDFQQFIDLCML